MHPSHPAFGRRIVIGGQRVRASQVTPDLVRQLDPQLAAAVAAQGRPADDASAARMKGRADGVVAERERCAAIWDLVPKPASKRTVAVRDRLIRDGADVATAREAFAEIDQGRSVLRDIIAAEAEVAGIAPLDGAAADQASQAPGASVLHHIARVAPGMLRQ